MFVLLGFKAKSTSRVGSLFSVVPSAAAMPAIVTSSDIGNTSPLVGVYDAMARVPICR